MNRYPDDRRSEEDGTVEPDQADPTPPGVCPRTENAGVEGQPGGPRIPISAADEIEPPE